MELANINISSFQHNQQQQQQQQTSLSRWESIDVDCHRNQQQQITEQPTTSLSIISLSPSMIISSSTIDDNNCEHFENNHCNRSKNISQIHEKDREKLVRFVYFGQIALIIIVALAWIAFTIL
ncbi:hypothetical protein WUBG_13489 [Wuchereria bancrofti]|uniref:Uncharacterized protein n=1 Tax=Wuchereria bancrofti TaxID=6293 RepID=J9EF20_WUCBA|nr:hypothetical protein WUBG_13489 [Wuchereria bancrofti]VDM15054.1 unnamed protein product [Wuchereria bancrofti]